MSLKSLTVVFLILPTIGFGQKDKDKVMKSIDEKYENYSRVAKQIWEFAEVGYQEEKSSALLLEELRKAGFTIESGVAGMPTAFVATYGSGKPVIGILGEYDALPGMSQKAGVAEQVAVKEGESGHGCGHHLFGTASMASVIAVKEWLISTNREGTIRFYGTPAEEGGSGKVYMVREGLFNDVDIVINWHPGSRNAANPGRSLANKTGKFRFYGVSAHAAGAPERGRSALDGVEAMTHMVNMMREHTTEKTRIHYVITKGGEAPNVVPAFAELYLYVRHLDREEVRSMWERVVKIAEGAALGTETRMEYEITGGVYDLLPNETLSKVMHANLTKVGGVSYTAEEKAYAEQVSKTLGKAAKPVTDAEKIQPYQLSTRVGGSTDVGDVSWAVPTVGMSAATWVPGTAAHSWQAVSCGGTNIGMKGMAVAAKSMALMALDLYKDPKLIMEAKAEFDKKLGPDFKYEALIGDRAPALDYRK